MPRASLRWAGSEWLLGETSLVLPIVPNVDGPECRWFLRVAPEGGEKIRQDRSRFIMRAYLQKIPIDLTYQYSSIPCIRYMRKRTGSHINTILKHVNVRTRSDKFLNLYVRYRCFYEEENVMKSNGDYAIGHKMLG